MKQHTSSKKWMNKHLEKHPEYYKEELGVTAGAIMFAAFFLGVSKSVFHKFGQLSAIDIIEVSTLDVIILHLITILPQAEGR